MIKKMKKYDIFFIAAMVATLVMHLWCIYGADHFADESFYPTVPLRLLNGDSLVQDEWHVTQFSSLFIYLPVRLWLAVKGSTQGIILFLRYFYLVIHTGASVGIYAIFRKYKYWAVVATLMFYSQVPLRFMSANYHSILALSLLILTVALLLIYEKDKAYLYLIAGFCYGCCCVCNPFECVLFVVYIIACIVWSIKYKSHKKKNKKLSDYEAVQFALKCKTMKKYFSAKAFFQFTAGLIIAAIISVIYFFGTGGTIESIIYNIPNLLNDGSHDISSPMLETALYKLGEFLVHYNAISFNLPFLLPALYLALCFDKKRKETNHKRVYMWLSLALSVFYTVGVVVGALSSSRRYAVALPFFILASVCYILTEKKNKKLFYCMWLPSVIATVVQYLASDMHLSVFWVLIIANIAGVFFVKDFLEEQMPLEKKTKSIYKTCQIIVCITICLQLVLQCGLYMVGRTVKIGYEELEKGPYAGLYLSQQEIEQNNAIMDDLDEIKRRSNPDDPVLIVSEFSWMYLYTERPFATYSAWQPYLEIDRLSDYIDLHPEKSPKYIYVGWVYISRSVTAGHRVDPDLARQEIGFLTNRFNCEVEELSSGILLTVKY